MQVVLLDVIIVLVWDLFRVGLGFCHVWLNGSLGSVEVFLRLGLRSYSSMV